MRFETWKGIDSAVQLMDNVVWSSKGQSPEEITEAERKQAIRHLRTRLVKIWCEYPLNNFEAHRQRGIILERIRRIRAEA